MVEAQWTWMVLATEGDHNHFLCRRGEALRVNEEETTNDAWDGSTWNEGER